MLAICLQSGVARNSRRFRITAYEGKFGGDYHTRWIQFAAELDDNITAADAVRWAKWTGKGSVDTWATEGVGFACSAAYINTDGKLIDPHGTVGDNALTAAYYTSRMRVVTQRLQQGGVRLAALLNKVLG